MRTLNVFLAIAISILLGAAVLELGLRLMGRGPAPTINRFDPETGWSKTPGAVGHRKTPEFDVTYKINRFGLRGPDLEKREKPAGTYRVLCLGDSFTLGYTVDEQDLFVEELGRAWKAEGRPVDVINAGTEGWSTDQEVQWYLTEGVKYQPDLVLLFPYENDIYWNGEASYRRYPKPRFEADGKLDRSYSLVDPGPSPWTDRWALALIFQRPVDPSGIHQVPFELTKAAEPPPGGARKSDPVAERKPGLLPREWAALMIDPPGFMQNAIQRTRGALAALKTGCEASGAKLIVVPIPSKAAVQEGAGTALHDAICLRDTAWSANQPVKTFIDLCHGLSIKTLDPTKTLYDAARIKDEHGKAPAFYYTYDWHFNPEGNRVFAQFLRDKLAVEDTQMPPAKAGAAVVIPATPEKSGVPFAVLLFGGLWVALTLLYLATYRDEPKWQPPLKVLLLLSAVFGIVIGGKALMTLVPPTIAPKIAILFVIGVLGFVFYKLGRRLTTIAELMKSFALRGHWYLMPLIVVLLSIGSLLVVAASSPLVAPFIYTLF